MNEFGDLVLKLFFEVLLPQILCSSCHYGSWTWINLSFGNVIFFLNVRGSTIGHDIFHVKIIKEYFKNINQRLLP